MDVNNTLDIPDVPSPDYDPIKLAYLIVLAIIIFVGFVTNSLSIAVFMKASNLKRTPPGVFLVALAVADILFLVGEMLRLLNKAPPPANKYLTSSDALCQFVFSIRYGAKLTSSWITVVITAQRLFIIAFPLRATSICTLRNAYIGIAITYFFSFLLGCFPILSLGVIDWEGAPLCAIKHDYLYNIFNWVILRIGSLILPGFIVLVSTVLICVLLIKASNIRKRHLSENSVNCNTSENAKAKAKVIDKHLTFMLLSVAIAFVLLRLPYTVMFYVNHYKSKDLDAWTKYHIYVGKQVTDLLASTNYAVNFFLYCLSGSTFRRQFFRMFGCEKAKRKHSSWSFFGQQTTSTTAGGSQCSRQNSRVSTQLHNGQVVINSVRLSTYDDTSRENSSTTGNT